MSVIAVLAGFNEIYSLFGAGFIGIIIHLIKMSGKTINGIFPFVLLQVSNTSINLSDYKIFWIFLK